ncbi:MULTISPECIES: response regulator transcription factor [Streptomyces]|uniref:response regulator transcription factor n=1 Tax=Streptomyces TaxID=1883 RepID=UPI001E581A17|nr:MULTISPECIES: helix-turn-helix transcriptional regulator [Streptomyces]UFQ15315.1 helix-turn-helix transcriptional regulator [Streptomyces huasconensis]WCL84920.1 helix-turn-helix transcriptional regulator [Streptomyces sp. JCM 35825]
MPATSRPQSAPALSHRERQVLAHIAAGLSHKQVARRLGISVHTVSTYLRRIRSKRTAPTVAHLIRLSMMEDVAAMSSPGVRPGS